MIKTATIAGIALAGAFAATGASAHDSFGHSHYSGSTSSTYGSTYTAPTVNLGPIEYVQPSSTVQYAQPSRSVQYIQPATTSTYSVTTPSYAAQTVYSSPTYTAPTYTAPTYTASTYTAPSYGTTYSAPTYTAPAYVAPTYYQPRVDLTGQVQTRLDRQRSRIRNAADRGELRRGERRKLRRNMREIRSLFESYKANDGVIDTSEQAALNKQLNRQSKRIRRLANNHRVAGPLVSPYSRY